MQFWTTKKVLVTGGCGFIGSHLVERLLVEGTKVCVADDAKRGGIENLKAVEKQIDMRIGDLADPRICVEVCIDYGTFPSLG